MEEENKEKELTKAEKIEEESRKIIMDATGEDPERPTDSQILATRGAAEYLAHEARAMEEAENDNRTNPDRDRKDNTYEK